MKSRTWKVGELSKITGLTIRTLHHYDEIGLLKPSYHTESGHRLYSEADIAKLQQTMSLKELNFSLEEIKEFFRKPDYSAKEIIELQIRRLNEEIKLKEALKKQLLEIHEVLDSWQKPSLEQFIKAIELIRNQSKYFSKEQRIKLQEQYNRLNSVITKELADQWSRLIALFQEAMDKGTPIDSPEVVELAKRWQQGINFFTGGDKKIIESAEHFYMDNPNAAIGTGMSGELYKYITSVLANIK